MKNNLKVFAFSIIIFATSCFGGDNVTDTVRSEGLTYTNTEVLHIHSKYVNKDFKIYIDMPSGYHHGSRIKYPSVFLLDADYSYPITKTIAEHLEDRNRIQKVFIFGIAYDGPPEYKLNRSRDYTPWHPYKGGYNKACEAISGGGPRFAEFISKELIPYLNKRYRIDDNRTLAGHSFGGLFATWLSLHSPTLFHHYIIVSPSLWFKNKKIFNSERHFLKNHIYLSEKIYFSIGDKENAHTYKMISDLKKYVSLIQSSNYPGLKFKFQILSDEDHDTVFPAAVTNGLLYIYN